MIGFKETTPYWIMLHVAAIDLALAAVMLGLTYATGNDTAHQTLLNNATAALHILLLSTLLFATHGPPYRWFYLTIASAVVAVNLGAFVGVLIPFGQMQFWAAAMVSRILGDAIVLPGPLHVPAALLLCVCSFIAVGLHIRQLHGAGNAPGFQSGYTSVGLALIATYALGTFGYGDWTSVLEIAEPADGNGNLLSPYQIVPAWNLLPHYAILRAIPGKETGLIIMVASLLIWFFIAYADRGHPAPVWRRSGYALFVFCFLANVMFLGFVGTRTVDAIPLMAQRISAALHFLLPVGLL
ncbi:MAG: hypothetical protein AAFR13_03970, partial [Pseudomonadota bacterium]